MAQTAKLLPAYLVVGADELKRRAAVTRLKARLDEGFSAFNLDERVASGDIDAQDLLSSLNTLPFGDSFRLVLVERAEKLPKLPGCRVAGQVDAAVQGGCQGG